MFFFLLLLIIPLVLSVNSGEDYMVKSIPQCIGEYKIEVKQQNHVDDYLIKNCKEKENNFWYCSCDIKNFTLKTFDNTSNIYDFIIFYNVPIIENDYSNYSENGQPSQLDIALENSKRQIEINDIKVDIKKEEKVKEPIKFPEITSVLEIGWVVLFTFMIILLLIYFVWKWVSKDEIIKDKNKIEKSKEIVDDDIINYLKSKLE